MAVDPVCNMEVDEKTGLSAEKDGKTWYFCSPGCRDEFLNPKSKIQDPKSEVQGTRYKVQGSDSEVQEPDTRHQTPDTSGEACEIPLSGDDDGENIHTQKLTMGITGMHCASCAANTEKALKKLDGVSDANVNIASESAAVEFDPTKVSTADIEKAVTDAGYTPHIREIPQESATIGITGMHCASCASSIEKALKKLDGVSQASVNFAAESASVRFDPQTVTNTDLEKAIKDAGYTPHVREERGGQLELKVVGMDNPHCLGTVDGALNRLQGITSKELFINEKAKISFDPSVISREEILQTIRDAGYTPIEETEAVLDQEKEAREREIKTLKFKFVFSTILGIPLLLLAMGPHIGIPMPHIPDRFEALIQFLLATPILVVNYQFYTRGILAVIKTRMATMDTLVALGTGAAWLYSTAVLLAIWAGKPGYSAGNLYYEVAGLLIVFILLGKWLEAIAKGKTSEAIKSLMGLQPKTALVIRNGKEIEIRVEDVNAIRPLMSPCSPVRASRLKKQWAMKLSERP
jgi:Cu+-exporting ATPase